MPETLKLPLADFTFGKLVEAKQNGSFIQGRVIGLHQDKVEIYIRVAFLGNKSPTVNISPKKLKPVSQDRLDRFKAGAIVSAKFVENNTFFGHIIYIIVDNGTEKIRVKFNNGSTLDVLPEKLTTY